MGLAGFPDEVGPLRPWWTALAWSLAQSLRRCAAWGVELMAAGAFAAAVLTPLGLAGAGPGGMDATASSVTGGTVLWFAASALVVTLLRRGDPLGRSSGWGEAVRRGGRLARRHPLLTAATLPVLVVGTLDEAGAATPAAVQVLQLLPALVAITLAGFGSGAAGGAMLLAARDWRERRGRGPRPGSDTTGPAGALAAGGAAVLSFVLCLVGVAGLASGPGLRPAALTAAGVATGGVVAVIALLWPRPRRPRPSAWTAAALGGAAAGAVAGGGAGLAVVGALLGGGAGLAMDAGARVARGQTILWRHRERLPAGTGDVVYSLRGRSMEITLESVSDTARREASRLRRGGGRLSQDGWRVAQLGARLWVGSKGRAELLGQRPDDLLDVIHLLHPEA